MEILTWRKYGLRLLLLKSSLEWSLQKEKFKETIKEHFQVSELKDYIVLFYIYKQSWLSQFPLPELVALFRLFSCYFFKEKIPMWEQMFFTHTWYIANTLASKMAETSTLSWMQQYYPTEMKLYLNDTLYQLYPQHCINYLVLPLQNH